MWRRPLLLPLALLLIGLVLLATNLGWLSPELWQTLGRLWPLVLVLLGVELLITGRASWGAGLFLILVLVVGGAVMARPSSGPFPTRPGSPPPPGSNQVHQTLNGARETEITLNFGAGHLSLAGGAPADVLIDGSANNDHRDSLRSDYQIRDGVGRLTINVNSRDQVGFFLPDRHATDAAFQLSAATPIRRLEVRTGAADTDLNLRDLNVRVLDLQTGASRTSVTLPAHGMSEASIQGGASSITVQVPEGVAADIHVDGGLSGAEIDLTRFPRTGGQGAPGLGFRGDYRSPNFDSASDRVTLRIQAGVSSIQVR